MFRIFNTSDGSPICELRRGLSSYATIQSMSFNVCQALFVVEFRVLGGVARGVSTLHRNTMMPLHSYLPLSYPRVPRPTPACWLSPVRSRRCTCSSLSDQQQKHLKRQPHHHHHHRGVVTSWVPCPWLPPIYQQAWRAHGHKVSQRQNAQISRVAYPAGLVLWFSLLHLTSERFSCVSPHSFLLIFMHTERSFVTFQLPHVNSKNLCAFANEDGSTVVYVATDDGYLRTSLCTVDVRAAMQCPLACDSS